MLSGAFVLVLLSHVYSGMAPTVVPGRYTSLAACEQAGKAFDSEPSLLFADRTHLCIPGPVYAP